MDRKKEYPAYWPWRICGKFEKFPLSNYIQRIGEFQDRLLVVTLHRLFSNTNSMKTKVMLNTLKDLDRMRHEPSFYSFQRYQQVKVYQILGIDQDNL